MLSFTTSSPAILLAAISVIPAVASEQGKRLAEAWLPQLSQVEENLGSTIRPACTGWKPFDGSIIPSDRERRQKFFYCDWDVFKPGVLASDIEQLFSVVTRKRLECLSGLLTEDERQGLCDEEVTFFELIIRHSLELQGRLATYNSNARHEDEARVVEIFQDRYLIGDHPLDEYQLLIPEFFGLKLYSYLQRASLMEPAIELPARAYSSEDRFSRNMDSKVGIGLTTGLNFYLGRESLGPQRTDLFCHELFKIIPVRQYPSVPRIPLWVVGNHGF